MATHMPNEKQTKLGLQIAHGLFLDVVSHSLAVKEAGQLTILPTGDGMALVFTHCRRRYQYRAASETPK